jgi:hypothetical protein
MHWDDRGRPWPTTWTRPFPGQDAPPTFHAAVAQRFHTGRQPLAEAGRASPAPPIHVRADLRGAALDLGPADAARHPAAVPAGLALEREGAERRPQVARMDSGRLAAEPAYELQALGAGVRRVGDEVQEVARYEAWARSLHNVLGMYGA